MINTPPPNGQKRPPVVAVDEPSAMASKDEGAQGPKPDGTSPDATPVVKPTEAETADSLPEVTHLASPAYEPDALYAPVGWYQSADEYPSGPFYPAPRASTSGHPADD